MSRMDLASRVAQFAAVITVVMVAVVLDRPWVVVAAAGLNFAIEVILYWVTVRRVRRSRRGAR